MPMEPGNRDDEQVAVRHADASGGDITENHHEEDRMRDIHIGKRGSEAAGEEQPDKFRKTVRFVNKKLRVHQRLQIQLSLWSILQLVRHKIGWGPYLCRKSGHVEDDVRISACDAFYEMDGRKSRYIGEVLEWYREEEAGDLKRSEFK